MKNDTMKKYILIFLTLTILIKANAQRPCDHIIKQAEYSWDAKAKGVKPGQTVCFQSGTRSSIDLYNLIGTKEAPVTLTNEPGGKVLFSGNGKTNTQGLYTTPFAAQIHGSSNFRVTGSNNPAEEYGFEITKSHMGLDIRGLSTDVEIDHIYVHDISSVGLVVKTDPTCDSKTWRGNFTLRNVNMHDNKVENTVNEGTYIGNSHYTSGVTKTCSGVSTKLLEHDVIGVEVYNNIFTNIGYDGIQVGSTLKDCNIHDNIINGVGVKKAYGHQSGIQINQGTVANIYKNTIRNGSGFGVFLGGSGGIPVYENLIENMEQGAVLPSDFAPIVKSPFLIHHNTFINCKDYTLWVNSPNTLGNSFAYNVVASSRLKGDGFYYNSTAQKATWKIDVNNVIVTDLASLKLDADYVPTKESPLNGLNVGYKQRKEVIETGWEVIRVDGEFYFLKDGERVKL